MRNSIPITDRTPSALIVGAGFGGLAAALELKRHGIDSFEVLERRPRLGGVWEANRYPGAGCDLPSAIYQYSFALHDGWSRVRAPGSEIRDYLGDVARRFGVFEHIRFGAAVVAADFDEEQGRWLVELDGGEQLEADFLICATGQLSEAKVPAVPGRESFAGPQLHSAEWDEAADLRGRRVVVVGGGASAVQLVPAIADEVERVTVVQRSANWVSSKSDRSTTRFERSLFGRVPALRRLHRQLVWWWCELRYPLMLRRFDPFRRLLERALRLHIRIAVRDRRKAAALQPEFPFGCNRILMSNDWYRTIAREDVDVVKAAVTAVTPTGVRCSDGREIACDAIVWCTGFAASEYLAGIRVRGRGGADLQAQWPQGPEAYLGMTVPGFPNLFMLYGPNTSSLINTITFLLERQASYVRQAIEHVGAAKPMAGNGRVERRWVDVHAPVHDAYNARLQQRLGETVFSRDCPGWYRSPSGKVTQVWPSSYVDYAQQTAHFDPSDYEHGRVLVEDPAPTAGGVR